MDNIIQIAIFLPLVAFLISGIFYNRLKGLRAAILNSALLSISAVLSGVVFYDVVFLGHIYHLKIFQWFKVGSLDISWSIYIDVLSSLMLIIVNVVSALVHIYSTGYMDHNKKTARFMSYLSLFTFLMLMLVTSDNLIQLFFGWEGVGLCSYLLIGYWYHKEAANNAALKAFWVNRVADLFFLIGILTLYITFGSFEFDKIFAQVSGYSAHGLVFAGFSFNVIDFVTLLLFIGCMGKSAQIFFHVWLPDAMEGPTPVSALIHAATMVTAGIFLIVRLSPVFAYSDFTLGVITVVGSVTCFFAAVIAIFQNDIKKIIAYSTCSQLGYMFFACGVSAYPAAMFHLGTHAFFKALLFLGAGSVIHALSGEQDIRRMGGIWKKIPFTYAMMIIGTLALVGVFPFAGYFSKDLILDAAYAKNTELGIYAYFLGILTICCTAIYSIRLIFFVFHGDQQISVSNDKNIAMRISMLCLSLGAVFSGILAVYCLNIGAADLAFWRGSIASKGTVEVMSDISNVSMFVQKMPMVISILVMIITWVLYKFCFSFVKRLQARYNGIYDIISKKFYIDELYDIVFVQSFKKNSEILDNIVEKKVIDAKGPHGVTCVVNFLSRHLSRFNSGFVYNYLAVMLLFLVIILAICLFMGIM